MSTGNPHKPVRNVHFGPVCRFAAAALLGALAAAMAGCGGEDQAVPAPIGTGGSGGSDGAIGGSGGKGGTDAAAGTDGQAGTDVSVGGTGGQAGIDASVGGGGIGGRGGQAGTDVSVGGTAGDAAPPDTGVDAGDVAVDAWDDCGCACQTEVCNGVDDNCNGQTDESDPRVGGPCNAGGQGICQFGKYTGCSAGQIVCTAQVEAGTRTEVCNDQDDDCDGTPDNNLNDPNVGVDCGVSGKYGECAKGKTQCVSGNVVCGQVIAPTTETCNGKDDDCDQVVDNPAIVNGANCDTGKDGVCKSGKTSCVDGGTTCVQQTAAGAESCNGLDDDCNGTVDDVGDAGTNDAGVPTCLADNPGAAHVKSWGCSTGGSNCAISQCDPNWSNVDNQVSTGCECGTADAGISTATGCSAPIDITVPAPTAGTPNPFKTWTGIIPAQNAEIWFSVTFQPTYAPSPTSNTGIYRLIEMTDAGDGGYAIAYGEPGSGTECMKSTGCPPDALPSGTPGGTGPTRWELRLTHPAGCQVGVDPNNKCRDLTTVPPMIRVKVTRTQPPACRTFTIRASSQNLAARQNP